MILIDQTSWGYTISTEQNPTPHFATERIALLRQKDPVKKFWR